MNNKGWECPLCGQSVEETMICNCIKRLTCTHKNIRPYISQDETEQDSWTCDGCGNIVKDKGQLERERMERLVLRNGQEVDWSKVNK